MFYDFINLAKGFRMRPKVWSTLIARTATHPDFVQIDNFICELYGNDELVRENVDIFRCFEDYNVPLERITETSCKIDPKFAPKE